MLIDNMIKLIKDRLNRFRVVLTGGLQTYKSQLLLDVVDKDLKELLKLQKLV